MYSAGYSVCHRHQHDDHDSQVYERVENPPWVVSLATRNPPRLFHTTCTDRLAPGPPCCISASSTCIAVVASAWSADATVAGISPLTLQASAIRLCRFRVGAADSSELEWSSSTSGAGVDPDASSMATAMMDVGSVVGMLSKLQIRCLGSRGLRATAAGARHVVLLLLSVTGEDESGKRKQTFGIDRRGKSRQSGSSSRQAYRRVT